MQAGRDLDAEVAVKVMGWMLVHKPIGDGPRTDAAISPTTQCMMSIPHYSTDIEAAWAVVEKLLADEYLVNVKAYHADHFPMWEVCILDHHGMEQKTQADTAPLAICLAALKAIGPAGQEG